jgi:hypothetical protein
MYHHCIFCSSDLGRNESIEHFQVGGKLAFDAWKGRLWAVCPRCARWNLAPLESRWEAVEEAEKRFRDSRMRVHSENIGLAKLPDGTKLIRVGEALPGELAAWRYGDQIVRRRWRGWVGAGTTVVAMGALTVGGLPLMAAAGAPAALTIVGLQLGSTWLMVRNEHRPLLRLEGDASPGGEPIVIRQAQARFARLVPSESGDGPALLLPSPLPPQREQTARGVRWVPAPEIRLEGEKAQRLLDRTLVLANAWGLSARRVGSAVERLAAEGGAEAFLERVSHSNAGLFPQRLQTNNATFDPRGGWQRFVGTFKGEMIQGHRLPNPPRSLPRVETLALEMALRDEAERRALQGELKLLEQAWKEAEEIAQIADALPDEPATG